METQSLTLTPTSHSTLPLFGRRFVAAYATTMRPYLMFVSGITGIAGLSLAEGVYPPTGVLVALASFLSYGFGQALTDCFQTDTDRLSSPYRPLTQGIISRAQVFAVSIPGLILCVSAFAIANPINVCLGILAGFGLATYTPFKRRWWGGPFYNAWIVALLFLMASLSGRIAVNPATILTISAVFFGYANFVLSGYFKDVEADRATGYNTLPVVYGRRRAATVSDLFAFCAAACAVLVIGDALGRTTELITAAGAVALTIAGVATAAVAQIRLHRVSSDDRAHRAIVPVVHSYLLLLMAIATARQPHWIPWLIAFYGAFVLTMKRRPVTAQI